MSTKEREPLLSDEWLATLTPDEDWPEGPVFYPTSTMVRNIYEAARAKDAELIQRFVDHNDKWLGRGCIEADMEWDDIVLDCIKAGYKPSEP
jgi:hypothetical protein